jgi:hypothetical protein
MCDIHRWSFKGSVVHVIVHRNLDPIKVPHQLKESCQNESGRLTKQSDTRTNTVFQMIVNIVFTSFDAPVRNNCQQMAALKPSEFVIGVECSSKSLLFESQGDGPISKNVTTRRH